MSCSITVRSSAKRTSAKGTSVNICILLLDGNDDLLIVVIGGNEDDYYFSSIHK